MLLGVCQNSFNLLITLSRHTSFLLVIFSHVVCMMSNAGCENLTIFHGRNHLADNAPDVINFCMETMPTLIYVDVGGLLLDS